MCQVSVIVPVYNTKPYLDACVNSILSQGNVDFEVLLVDDGSTDGSASLCDYYAETDKRIRVFHQIHGGVSLARNRGIEEARGEWMCFVDSDDEWLDGGLRALIDGASDAVDMVMMGYESYDEQDNLVYAVSDRVVRALSPVEGLMQIFKPSHYSYYGYLFAKLFRSSVIRAEKCRFAEDISFCEDRLFTVQFICSSRRPVQYNSLPVYRYRLRSDGAMGSLEKAFNPKFLSDLDATVRIRSSVRSSFPESSDVCFAANKGVYNSYRTMIERIRKFQHQEEGLEKKLRAKTIDSIGRLAFTGFEMKRIARKVWRSCCQ